MNESLLELSFLPDDLHFNAYQNLRHNPFLIQVNSYDIEQIKCKHGEFEHNG